MINHLRGGIVRKELGLICMALTATWGWSAEVVTHGDRVDLTDHLEPGHYVMFDFYADWCGPCRQLDPHLNALVREHGGELVLKKVDIINWNSPVTQQYGIRSIPHLKLFSPDGDLISEGGARSVLADLSKAMGGSAMPTRSLNAGGGSGGFGLSLLPVIAVICLILFAAGIVAFVLIGQRERRQASMRQAAVDERRMRYQTDPKLDPVWIVNSNQGELEPMSVEDIRALLLGGRIRRDWQVRRKNDPLAMTVSELMHSI